MKRLWLICLLLTLTTCCLSVLIAGCDDDDDDDDDDGAVGTLEFFANGEEFIREGFVGKTGWAISFDQFLVNYSGPTAFQVAEDTEGEMAPLHAGHPHDDIPEGSAHITLDGDYPMDLATGDDRGLVGAISDAPVGNYNYLNFNVKQAAEGELADYSILMSGAATKDERTVSFTIRLDEQMTFTGCHQEVDDEFAGVVDEDGLGAMELTFHSDHIFGDQETLGEEGSVNDIALGFEALAALAQGDVLDIDQNDLSTGLSGADYLIFIEALRTTGHSGEGHCEYQAYSE